MVPIGSVIAMIGVALWAAAAARESDWTSSPLFWAGTGVVALGLGLTVWGVLRPRKKANPPTGTTGIFAENSENITVIDSTFGGLDRAMDFRNVKGVTSERNRVWGKQADQPQEGFFSRVARRFLRGSKRDR